MRDGKGKFYRQLTVDKTTRNAIRFFNKIKFKMMRD